MSDDEIKATNCVLCSHAFAYRGFRFALCPFCEAKIISDDRRRAVASLDWSEAPQELIDKVYELVYEGGGK